MAHFQTFWPSATMVKKNPLSLQTVHLKVRMCCSGCEKLVKRSIFKLRGINSVEVDMGMEKVTVVGYVDRNKVLKIVRRSGKKAEFWPYPDPPLYFTETSDYFKDMTNEYRDSYNYRCHGYNLTHNYGTFNYRWDDRISNIFNDENIHSCHIM